MNLEQLSTPELIKKEKSTKVLTYMLAGMLLVLLGLAIFISFRDGVSALIAVPIALSTVVMVNLKNIKTIQLIIKSREETL